MQQTILIIEDQLDFQLMVKALLEKRYQIVLAATAADAIKLAEEHPIDLVILDVMLPDADGFELYSRLKALPPLSGVPIIFLTGKTDIPARVRGLTLGAEDYIVKPFEPMEFRARIESKLQARLSLSARDIIRSGRLALDRTRFRASWITEADGLVDLELTPHEFRLLLQFVTHEGQALSRENLMMAVWGSEVHVLERTIDRHISSLRKKLAPLTQRLEAVHGVGYRLSQIPSAKNSKSA